MKKICQCCGRNRRLGKFGKVSANPDGKNVYCRDCMRNKRKISACKPKGRKALKKATKKWKRRNKKHIQEYNKEYYLLNKDRILYDCLAKRSTECVLIFDDDLNDDKQKINNSKHDLYKPIEINPKEKENGRFLE